MYSVRAFQELIEKGGGDIQQVDLLFIAGELQMLIFVILMRIKAHFV